MSRYFHFTLGPVQGFVAQARRTRDFWAGSFILSWLSAVAMKAVERQNGEIVFPTPDESFMRAVSEGGNGPRQGCIPNRFMAKVADGFDPELVEKAVQTAWLGLAASVWQNDLQDIADEKTRTVWERQIAAFWEIEWALTDEETSAPLDRLKLWRTHLPPDEEGVKCMMMDGWQELSGAERPGDEPKRFWEKLRGSGKSALKTDLRPGEMLCAVAYVKRRFVRCFEAVAVEMAGGWMVRGWRLPAGVPSVHYLAVAPWLAQLIGKAHLDDDLSESLWKFHDAAYRLTGNYGEWSSNIRCVCDAVGSGARKKWAALDGTVFFDTMLENQNLWDEGQRKTAADVLGKLQALRGKAELDPPSPFYAVLLMDGDELGIQMGDSAKHPAITQGLAAFTGGVADVVEAHNGFLVYAGGDDVLALLPLEDALNCAAALREFYLACFADSNVSTSISAAIEYAHVKMPLGKVLGDAHDLLDELAKEGRGRDAIACRVWKPGGMALEWAMPWEIALNDEGVVIEGLAKKFQQNQKATAAEDEDEPGRFASKFFYRIGERFDLLNPRQGEKPVLDTDQAVSLMAMEYLNSGTSSVKTMDEARAIVQPLLKQCRLTFRKRDGKQTTFEQQPLLETGGALLVRFLAQKGVER